MFWGLSPALDLLEEYHSATLTDRDELHIMVIGGCDARHIIKTLAQSYRHKETNINIHVIEGCPELLARQLLLLSIALTNPTYMGLQEKTRYFMEIYGNTLLRSTTSRNLNAFSKQAIKMITNLEYMKEKIPLISYENVKYRERDYIEMLLKFWGTGSTNRFDICALWDGRLRRSLGARYDSRFGVFDWDYNMRLRDVGGTIVNSQEYKHFRTSGVAFTWLETEVSRPNCSLAAGVIKMGDEFTHRGYLGDVVTGPYIAYGLDCEDKSMMKSNHGTFFKRSTDITERNLIRMFYELQCGEAFDPFLIDRDHDHNLGLVTVAVMEAKLSEQSAHDECVNVRDDTLHFINIARAKVFFHSASAVDKLTEKLEYLKKFQTLFVGQHFCKKIKPAIINIMETGGLVMIEGPKFNLDLKKDDMKAFGKYVKDMAKDFGCEFLEEFDPLKDSFAKLVVK